VHRYVSFLFGVVLFYYFYTEMLCTGCGSRQCQTKSNIAEQNLQNFTIFCATMLLLRTTALNCTQILHVLNHRILTALMIYYTLNTGI